MNYLSNYMYAHHSLSACHCHLLITFANSLDPDQARQNFRSDLNPKCLTMTAFLKWFLKKVNFKKPSIWQKKHAKLLRSGPRKHHSWSEFKLFGHSELIPKEFFIHVMWILKIISKQQNAKLCSMQRGKFKNEAYNIILK